MKFRDMHWLLLCKTKQHSVRPPVLRATLFSEKCLLTQDLAMVSSNPLVSKRFCIVLISEIKFTTRANNFECLECKWSDQANLAGEWCKAQKKIANIPVNVGLQFMVVDGIIPFLSRLSRNGRHPSSSCSIVNLTFGCFWYMSLVNF